MRWFSIFFTLWVFGGTVFVTSTEEGIAHVAFVFAGGVRSFRVPAIHESIRYNLIHAFCPVSNCIADVFVRLSIDDNTHNGVGYNAMGKKLEGSEEMLAAALKALRRLQPSSPKGKLLYKIVNIGSQEEADEMDPITSKNFRQKIYRDLDPRRYSMYFNRAMAYKMMLEEEARWGQKYMWVVHARLDTGWGEAIRPFNVWSLAKVWTPDSWYADVPDTFLLLPRIKGDYFFDLDLQYNPTEIMCLGGPNFDPATTTDEALKALGYTPEQALLAQGEICMTKYNQNAYIVAVDKKANITWTSAGTSEVYLKRKLKHHGICREKGTIGFTSLFMFIARFPLQFVCFYIEPRYYIPWVKATQHTSDPIGVGCNLMWRDMNILYDMNHGPNCNLETFSSKYPLTDQPMTTCLLDRRMTDWNFMPFRIRRKGNMCLTTVKHPAIEPSPSDTATMRLRPTLGLTMAPCIDSVLKVEFVHDYDEIQLFGMFPLSPLPQRISNHWFDKGRRCLTASADFAVIGKEAFPKVLLEMQECHVNPNFLPQLFRVQLLSDLLSPDNASSWAANPIVGVEGGDLLVPRLPLSSIAVIRWMGEGESLCLNYQAKADASSAVAGAGAVGREGGTGGGVAGEGSTSATNVSTIIPLKGNGGAMLHKEGVFASLSACFTEADQSKKGPGGGTDRRQQQKQQRKVIKKTAVFVLERTRNFSPTV